ncbi:helix-turn-helix domain-containing protein [Lentibacillus jeotgali]|uniref:helix-turn-helix domain-containing protein n=1 Tax=Lentibacillus jeotgali TaxID=558169 RepID=UPI003CCB3C76
MAGEYCTTRGLITNLKDWEILSVIKKEGNITKASRKLFMTQPAITLRVKNIEKELGIAILYRTNCGTQLNRQGEYLASQADNLQLKLVRQKHKTKRDPVTRTGSRFQTLLFKSRVKRLKQVFESIQNIECDQSVAFC